MMINYYWHDLVGNLGVFIILLSYLLLQLNRLKSDSIYYSLLNLIGASAVTLSLFYNFNLSAFIIEVCWIVISGYGIARALNLANH